jgi:hypothetical protein
MSATPRPWKVIGKPGYEAPIIVSEKRSIAKVLYHSGSEDNDVDGNAVLIIHAVNLHDDLVRELEEMVSIARCVKSVMIAGKIPGWQTIDATFDNARAILARDKEVQHG